MKIRFINDKKAGVFISVNDFITYLKKVKIINSKQAKNGKRIISIATAKKYLYGLKNGKLNTIDRILIIGKNDLFVKHTFFIRKKVFKLTDEIKEMIAEIKGEVFKEININ